MSSTFTTLSSLFISTLDVKVLSVPTVISSTAVSFVVAKAVAGTIATVITAAISNANFLFILFPPLILNVRIGLYKLTDTFIKHLVFCRFVG